MARFYFRTEDDRFFPDDIGQEFEDLDEAKAMGLTIIWELVKADPDEFWGKENFKILILDEGHEVLYTFELGGTEAPDPFA